jgi:amino acid transporter
MSEMSEMSGLLAAFNAAFLSIFWAYDGWYLLSFSGGEIKNPRRNIPAGFILGIVIVIGVYVATSVVYFGVLDLESMKAATGQGGAAAEVARRLYGSPGVALLALGIIGSTLGAANGNVLTGPRLSYAMAQDGLFFRTFGRVHAQYLTPFVSIIVQGALGIVYVFLGTFDQLTEHVVFAAWVFYLLTVLGGFRLRRRFAAESGVFRAPGYPILPALFVAFAAAFIAYSFWESATLAWRYVEGDAEAKQGVYPLISASMILLGVPLYWLFRREAQDRS